MCYINPRFTYFTYLLTLILSLKYYNHGIQTARPNHRRTLVLSHTITTTYLASCLQLIPFTLLPSNIIKNSTHSPRQCKIRATLVNNQPAVHDIRRFAGRLGRRRQRTFCRRHLLLRHCRADCNNIQRRDESDERRHDRQYSRHIRRRLGPKRQ